MIPPEPGPDPPTPPVVLGYTYENAIPVLINGSFPGMIYTSIKNGDDNCYVTGTTSPKTKETRSTWNFDGILVYTDASQEIHNCFVRSGYLGYNVILDVNSDIGLTVPLYFLSSDGNFNADSNYEIHIDSSTPSDYYGDVVSGDYELSQRE